MGKGSTPPKKQHDGPRETSAGLAVPGEQQPRNSSGSQVNPAAQSELYSAAQPQDTLSSRAKATRKGKITPDNASMDRGNLD